MTIERYSLRLVDSHVHHWNPANLEWYPHLAPDFDVSALGVDGADGMKRRYNQSEYVQDARSWGLDKYIHVSATSGPRKYLDETAWLAGLGAPLAGAIGTVDLHLPADEAVADLKKITTSPLLKGIRNMEIPDWQGDSFLQVLQALQDRKLVYDLVVHPHTVNQAISALTQFPELSVVVEHAGWPESTMENERQSWLDGMTRLAALGRRVTCKLSGIAMFTHSTEHLAVESWFRDVVGCFGIDRCMIGSNFPVDGVFGTFDNMFSSYLQVANSYGDQAVKAIFAENAERVYGI